MINVRLLKVDGEKAMIGDATQLTCSEASLLMGGIKRNQLQTANTLQLPELSHHDRNAK